MYNYIYILFLTHSRTQEKKTHTLAGACKQDIYLPYPVWDEALLTHDQHFDGHLNVDANSLFLTDCFVFLKSNVMNKQTARWSERRYRVSFVSS